MLIKGLLLLKTYLFWEGSQSLFWVNMLQIIGICHGLDVILKGWYFFYGLARTPHICGVWTPVVPGNVEARR